MIFVPDYVDNIIEKLYIHGFEAYMVGGCVRDSLMGKSPSDYDITTTAKPEDIKKIFKKTIDTGLKHGTVTVIEDINLVEITTYRLESEYEDNRRPKSVEFVSDLKTDLSRRDFTINAMSFNKRVGLIDFFNGREDLNKKIIKTVGNPDFRFNEDALRMLRAVRFCSSLGFSLDNETEAAIKDNSRLIKNISKERIKTELDKILLSKSPEKILMLYETELLNYIIPEFSLCFTTVQNTKYHIFDVGIHTIKALENSPDDLVIRWALLFHDIGKPIAKSTDEKGIDHFHGHPEESARLALIIMDRLKFSNDIKKDILPLVKEHDTKIKPDKKEIKKMINKIGISLFLKLIEVKKCDLSAKAKVDCEIKSKELNEVSKLANEIIDNKEPIFIKDLAVSGEDVASLGFRGREIGDKLLFLLEHVFLYPYDNKKDILLGLINK